MSSDTPSFFVPAASSKTQALNVYRDYAKTMADRDAEMEGEFPIYRVRYERRGVPMTATVGEVHGRPEYYGSDDDLVLMIMQEKQRNGLIHIVRSGALLRGENAMWVGVDRKPVLTYFSTSGGTQG